MQSGTTFFKAFWAAARVSPPRAIGALYWRLLGRKVRARNRLRMTIQQGPDAYDRWINEVEEEELLLASVLAKKANWRVRPTFSVVLHLRREAERACLDSLTADLAAQIYADWELIVVPGSVAVTVTSDEPGVCVANQVCSTGSAALRSAADLARGDYLLPVAPGARLPATALFHYAQALQAEDADLLFGDHDQIGGGGERIRPWFKPAWNDELALAQDYVSQAFAVAVPVARRVLQDGNEHYGAAAYALVLAAARAPGAKVRHVAHVQAHLRVGSESTIEERCAVVENQIGKLGATASPAAFGTVRIDWQLPDPQPLVSIIVPTRDQLSLLRTCLSSLHDLTTYRPFEVIIVDNGSTRPETLTYLRDLAGRDGFEVIRDERPFNFSRLNNLAVAHARGEYLCLLNNDTEVVQGEWLTAMMRQAVRDDVGAVGARLLYDDRSIQHAGVAIGMGEMGAADHPHRFLPCNSEGYFARTHAAHYVSAVTAACLVVERRKFLSVGGFDEEGFAVAFNDVDLCLKLRQAGWQNVYTPHATLLHHESKSRGKDFSSRHIERFQRELGLLRDRWRTLDYVDPLLHVRLDRASTTFAIRL